MNGDTTFIYLPDLEIKLYVNLIPTQAHKSDVKFAFASNETLEIAAIVMF